MGNNNFVKKCDFKSVNFAETCDFENTIFGQNWHLKCEFCEKFDFENVNYANYIKNVIQKM